MKVFKMRTTVIFFVIMILVCATWVTLVELCNVRTGYAALISFVIGGILFFFYQKLDGGSTN